MELLVVPCIAIILSYSGTTPSFQQPKYPISVWLSTIARRPNYFCRRGQARLASNTVVSQPLLKPFGMQSKPFHHFARSALGCRWGTSASIATKSNACTQRAISLRRSGYGPNSWAACQLNQIRNFGFTAVEAPRGTTHVLSSSVPLRPMTSITYLNGSSSESEAVRLCRQKARDCQRTALASTDHDIRVRYWHLAKLWHEMARHPLKLNLDTVRPSVWSLKGRSRLIGLFFFMTCLTCRKQASGARFTTHGQHCS
jgi:hypothetical protein